MILVVDVGNSNMVLGVYQGRELLHHFRLSTSRQSTVDEYGVLIYNLFHMSGIRASDIEGIIISSVVPPLVNVIEAMCEKYVGKKPLLVGPGIKTGLNLRYENPREVGADRIVNAVAAVEKYGGPLVVVDFGTATTFDCIDEKGHYLGELLYLVFTLLPKRSMSGHPSCLVLSWRNPRRSLDVILFMRCKPALSMAMQDK